MRAYDRHAMKMDEIATGLSDAKAEGEAMGEAKTKREMVMEMHREGIDKQVIAKISHLPLEEVDEILAEADTAKD
jgi:hypothetical protein